MTRRWGAIVGWVALCATLAAASAGAGLVGATPASAAPAPVTGLSAPASDANAQVRVVAASGPYRSILDALAVSRPGDVIEVHGGRHPGPLVIDRPVRLRGVGEPVIDGGGRGTVVRIAAPGVELRGFAIRGSGDSLDREDSGVYVESPSAVIEANSFVDVLFGVYLRGAPGSRVAGNRIAGKDLPIGRKGDGIRVWNSGGSELTGNRVSGVRDLILQSSPGSVVRGNTIEDGRYGIHLMTSDGCVVEDNLLRGNSVGAYAMFSAGLVMRGNALVENRGPSGYGIGLKDMDDVTLEENQILRNRVGIYVDNSPRSLDATNAIRRNVLAGNDAGILLQPSVTGNVIAANAFVDNHVQVAISGSSEPRPNRWEEGGRGNYWSDYAGYDAGGDGVGDLPYRAQSLFENLMDERPALRWFIYSPAALAVDLAARAFPAVQPRPKLTDPAPLMAPDQPPGMAAPRPPTSRPLLLASLGEVAAAAAVLGATLRGRRGRSRRAALAPATRLSRAVTRSAKGEAP